MQDMTQENSEPMRSPTSIHLTRRAFLRMSTLAAGLGGVALTGCGMPPGPGTHIALTTAQASVEARWPGLVVPAGLGVNLHSVTTNLTQIAQLAALGMGFARLDFPWDKIEQQKGIYDFASYEPVISALHTHNIRPFCILAYNNPLYAPTFASQSTHTGPQTDEVRRAFARFAGAASAHFKGRGIVWEIWNEPDYPHFWLPKSSPDDYMALAKLAIASIRRTDPDALVIAPALVGLEPRYQTAWSFLERCIALGLLDLVDALSVHPYRLGPPESATADYQRLRALIARSASHAKANLPIVNSEWGYSLTWVSREQQAAYFTRLYLINLLNGLPVSIWYDWIDDGSNPKQINDNFGLLTQSGQRKPAYLAAQTLTHELTGFQFSKRVPFASTADYQLLFTKGATTKRILWTTSNAHRVALPLSAPSIKLIGMTGETHSLLANNGTVEVEISGDPQYLLASI